MVSRTLFLLIAFIGSMLLCAIAQAVPTDVRFLIDISGSMYEADRQQIRQNILQAIPKLLPEGTSVGVWTFSDSVQKLIEWGPLDSVWSEEIPNALPKISDLGLGSNLSQAVVKVSESWFNSVASGARILILISDGGIYLSPNASENRVSREYLLAEVLPRLKASGVQVISMGLSNKADVSLLGSLAEESKGRFVRMNHPTEAVKYLKNTLSELIQLANYSHQKNIFKVDSSVKQMTLFMQDKTDTPIKLRLPNGRLINKDMKINNIKWWSENHKTMVTIQEPMPGEWELLANLSPEHPYLLYKGLRLEVGLIPEKVILGESFDLNARLYDGESPVIDKSFLENIQVAAQLSQGSELGQMFFLRNDDLTPNVYKEVGAYVLKIPILEQSGESQLFVRAIAPTFLFEDSRSFSVYPTPAIISQQLEKSEENFIRYGVTVNPVEGLLDLQNTKLFIKLTGDNQKTRQLTPEINKKGFWYFGFEMDVTARSVKIDAKIKGYLNDGRIFSSELTPFIIQNIVKDKSKDNSQDNKLDLKFHQRIQKEIAMEAALQEDKVSLAIAVEPTTSSLSAWLLLVFVLGLEGAGIFFAKRYWTLYRKKLLAMIELMLLKLDVIKGFTKAEGIAV